MRTILAAILGFSVLFPFAVHAETSFAEFRAAHGDFIRLFDPDRTNLSLSYLNEPKMEEPDNNGAYYLQMIESSAGLRVPVTIDLFAEPGFGLEERIYDFENSADGLGRDTFWVTELSGNLGYFLSPNFLLIGGVRAGAYSDLDGNTNGEDFRLFGGGLAVYRLTQRFQLVAGAESNEYFERIAVLPMFGFRWLSAQGAVHLDVTLPVEAMVRIRILPSTEFYAGGWLSGNRFHVRFEPDPTERSVQVQERRFGFGVQHWLGRHFNVLIEWGLNAGSRFEVKNSDFEQFKGKLDPAPFLRLGVGAAL